LSVAQQGRPNRPAGTVRRFGLLKPRSALASRSPRALEVVLAVDAHGELQLSVVDTVRVGKHADEVVKRGQTHGARGEEKRIVLGMGIRTADDPVEGERIDERADVVGRPIALAKDESDDLGGSGTAVALVFAEGGHSQHLAHVLLMHPHEPSAGVELPIVAAHHESFLVFERSNGRLRDCQPDFMRQPEAEVLIDVETVEVPSSRWLQDVGRGRRARRNASTAVFVEQGHFRLRSRQAELPRIAGQSTGSVRLHEIPQALGDPLLGQPIDLTLCP
jgi:hypothetical protein